MSADFRIVVYGASGYTGRMVVEHLREQGMPFIAAGRSRKRIEEALHLVPGIEDSLPRSPTGKVLKKDIREPYWRASLGGSRGS